MLACDAGYDVSTGASELSTKKRQVGLEDAFAAEKRLKLDRDLLLESTGRLLYIRFAG